MSIFHKIFSKLGSIRSFHDMHSIGKTLIFTHILKKKTGWNIGYIRSNWKTNFNKNKIFKIPNSKNR